MYDQNGDETPLPEGSRLVVRTLHGSFVAFHKASLYNMVTGKFDAYNAIHNSMNQKEFRKHVSNIIQGVTEKNIEIEPERKSKSL